MESDKIKALILFVNEVKTKQKTTQERAIITRDAEFIVHASSSPDIRSSGETFYYNCRLLSLWLGSQFGRSPPVISNVLHSRKSA